MTALSTMAAYQALYVLPAALALLPIEQDTLEARALLVAIGLQESGFRHRRQADHGQARGYWQFEVGGVAGVLTHPASQPHLERILLAFDYPLGAHALYTAIEHSDVLAAVTARLTLTRLPEALPGRHDVGIGWDQYREVWRPGRPRREDWTGNVTQAWAIVAPLPVVERA